MSDKLYDIPPEWTKRAFINEAKYRAMYDRSIADPEGFWAEHGKRIHWMKPFSKVKNATFGPGNVSIKWFEDGKTNAAYNCVDRHLAKRADQTAIIWEGDDPKDSKKITYRQLHDEVCRMANVLKAQGVRHVILAGYNTDMCVCKTTAGYENLRRDFDVFLVGDATIATFPANSSPRFATNAAVSFAALDLLITQTSWITPLP